MVRDKASRTEEINTRVAKVMAKGDTEKAEKATGTTAGNTVKVRTVVTSTVTPTVVALLKTTTTDTNSAEAKGMGKRVARVRRMATTVVTVTARVVGTKTVRVETPTPLRGAVRTMGRVATRTEAMVATKVATMMEKARVGRAAIGVTMIEGMIEDTTIAMTTTKVVDTVTTVVAMTTIEATRRTALAALEAVRFWATLMTRVVTTVP
mmetsp:Transcript_1477/g.1684  ORF Transcript_1477/g.1684 Transcript_1477/m.1684 type:complete len:208 (-) Transcript_1477:464-1087(-)